MLPDWPAGTVAVLTTLGDGPFAIPVSTAQRRDDRTVVLALARSRGSLQRLRADPRVALTVVASGDLAITAVGRARVVAERLEAAETVAAVAVEVDEVRDHGAPTYTIAAGVDWEWTDDEARAKDAAVRRELAEVAA